MVVDDSGQILENNARALELLRPLETDAPLTYLFPIIQPAHHDRVQRGFVVANELGTCELNELSFEGGSNGIITGDMHIARIDNPEDDRTHYICAIIDQGPLITQRSALQASAATLQLRNDELLRSRTRLSAIINSSLDSIICVDPHQNITVFNPAAATLFQCGADQALGRPVAEFLPQVALALTNSQAPSPVQLGEMIGHTLHGGGVSLDVSMSFEQHPDGDIVTLFVHDLTHRKKMEANRAALETQLRESQKMQAIGTMAGGIAHDFNNIISAILGNVELARQDALHDAAVSTSLTEIDKAGRRARDLVRQILTFSRNEPPRRLPLQLADVIHETLRLIKVTMPPQVELKVALDPAVPAVMADATQVEQVLLNLCTNAIHAIGPQPGCIQVTLSQAGRWPDITVDDNIDRCGRPVQLTVTDTGCGMNDETLGRIFEPFFTTKPVGQGTGLGLSVVHGIMRAHAGLAQVRSTPNNGSEFALYFPVAEAVAVTLEPIACGQAQAMGRGQRVMYVDDDEALVFLVKRVLTRKGYKVVTFMDPKAAVASLTADPFQCDLLVTDFNMPGYSGVDLLRAVQVIRPTLPVALASGYVTPEIERDALAAGARALIHKPNDVDELCNTVQRLLDDSPRAG
jgi:PAS domain S-box-containing protein